MKTNMLQNQLFSIWSLVYHNGEFKNDLDNNKWAVFIQYNIRKKKSRYEYKTFIWIYYFKQYKILKYFH